MEAPYTYKLMLVHSGTWARGGLLLHSVSHIVSDMLCIHEFPPIKKTCFSSLKYLKWCPLLSMGHEWSSWWSSAQHVHVLTFCTKWYHHTSQRPIRIFIGIIKPILIQILWVRDILPSPVGHCDILVLNPSNQHRQPREGKREIRS